MNTCVLRVVFCRFEDPLVRAIVAYKVGTKPPLGGGKIPCCTTKLVVDDSMITKVIFTWHWAGPRVEIAAGLAAVDV